MSWTIATSHQIHIKMCIFYEQMFCDIGSDLHICSTVDTKIRILDVFHGCVEYQGAIGVHVLGVGSLDIKSKPLRIVELLGHPEVDQEALAGGSQTHLDAFISISIYLSIFYLSPPGIGVSPQHCWGRSARRGR